MATNIPVPAPIDTLAHFNQVAEQIERTFNQLIAQLIERKNALLQKVCQLREAYESKETTRVGILEEHMEELRLKAGQQYQQRQKELETPTKLPQFLFTSPSLTALQSQISEFGEIVQWTSPDFSLKVKPFSSAGKLGKGEKGRIGGIALDESNGKVYIADPDNSRVQVFSFQGEFLFHFGEGVLKTPCGISVTSEEDIYITDRQCALFKFNKDTLKFVKKVGMYGESEGDLKCPNGLAVDTNDVFVADSLSHRVSVYSRNLVFFRPSIGEGKLYYPQDVKLTADTVIVLDQSPNCIRTFSRHGELLTSLISQGENNCLVYQPRSFCLDPDQNIVISDGANHTVKVFTRSGELIHTLGKKGKGKGEFIDPHGVSIAISGVIFVASSNPNHILQCF